MSNTSSFSEFKNALKSGTKFTIESSFDNKKWESDGKLRACSFCGDKLFTVEIIGVKMGKMPFAYSVHFPDDVRKIDNNTWFGIRYNEVGEIIMKQFFKFAN